MDRLMGVDEVVMGELDTMSDHDTKTDNWHLDVTYSPSPPAFAVNRCLVAPPAGGDTMWANLISRSRRCGRRSRERLVGLFTERTPSARCCCACGPRSTARRQPRSVENRHCGCAGRSCAVTRRRAVDSSLFCVDTTTPIAGMHPAESDAILGVLKQHCANPNFTCRWRWTPGDVVVWDERCTSHLAVRDPWAGPRSMRRVLVEGEPAIAGGAPGS